MWRTGFRGRPSCLLVVAALVMPGLSRAQEAPEQPGMPFIPGITADDEFSGACVSCHVVLPDGTDVRLSSLMRQWRVEVDSMLLTKARAAASPGFLLEGRHPDAEESLKSIPLGCLTCHGSDATRAPPFNRLMHLTHLVGDEANHFLTMFRGECTYCHKLDPDSGGWSIPTGPEPGS